MKKIANIVFENELTNHKKVNWINYVLFDVTMHNQINQHAYLGIPTLIIGWNLFKREFEYLKPNILNKNNDNNNICWEFSLDERINDHFTGLENFVKRAPRLFVENCKYITIDPIKDNVINEDHLINILNGYVNPLYCNLYQYKDEIIYLYDRTRFLIVGIYLNSFKYFKYNVSNIQNRIVSYVQENEKNIVTIDATGSIYQTYYKELPEFDQLKRTMVLFLS